MVAKKVIFPQANSINKIIIMIINFEESDLSDAKFITSYFKFSSRQGKYYVDALRFIGIIDEYGSLTKLGIKLRSFNSKDYELCRVLRNAILNRPVFKEVYEYLNSNNKFPSKDFIASAIIKYFKLSSSTANRRTSTVTKWINWAQDII